MKDLQTTLIEIPLLARTPNRYSAKNNVKPVHFYCTAPNAKAVCLVGDFNGWNPLANPMHRDASGSWTAQIELHHGHHHYVFLVDGEPMLDPNAYGIARNEKNERVSLIAVS
ncbi:MAG: glycoside hydrolase family 13 [Verrucomicrobia bacterium SCN 57-15]|nr:MAG: glycoside hydrolase family 13 [Verrucomicrobia bacterium SCN 57-15]